VRFPGGGEGATFESHIGRAVSLDGNSGFMGKLFAELRSAFVSPGGIRAAGDGSVIARTRPRWELRWQRADGGIVRLALTQRALHGLAAAFVAAVAIAVAGSLVGGLERFATRDALAVARAENQALGARKNALAAGLSGLTEALDARSEPGWGDDSGNGRRALENPDRDPQGTVPEHP
jgi:hypothetical protein